MNTSTDLLAFLRDIVSIPSVTGQEGACLARIGQEMTALGFDEVRLDAMGNLLGRIGYGPRQLALDGHVDTVDVVDASAWKHPPFGAVVENGRLYGRGAADQKGGLAAAVYAAAEVKKAGLPKDVTLWVVASVNEEDDEGLAWRHLIEVEDLAPDAVILTEPSDGHIMLGHRGRLEIEIAVKGVSCHGSAPERGVNPIDAASELAVEIPALNKRLSSDSPLGDGTVVVTDFRVSGPSLCAVPDVAVLHLDRRLTEGESAATCLDEIRRLKGFDPAIMSLSIPTHEISTHRGCVKQCVADYPAWRMMPEHRLVQAAGQAYRSVFGNEAPLDHWTFATHGVATAGLYDIPTIGYGPGQECMAHAVNESVRVQSVTLACEFYRELISAWCHLFTNPVQL